MYFYSSDYKGALFTHFVKFSRNLKKSDCFSRYFSKFILQYKKVPNFDKIWLLDYFIFYNSDFIMFKYKFKSKMCENNILGSGNG